MACNDSVDHTWTPCTSIVCGSPKLPLIWPVQEGTDLQLEEQEMLQKVGFVLPHAQGPHVPENIISTNEGEGVPESSHRRTHVRTRISDLDLKKIDLALSLFAKILSITVITRFEHEVFKIETKNSAQRAEAYDVSISYQPSCTCEDFQWRQRTGKPYLACKHMYYILLRVLGLDMNHNMCIHQPQFEKIDLLHMLSRTHSFSCS